MLRRFSRLRALAVIATAAALAPAQVETLRPGFDLFTPDQDVQLGCDARGEIDAKLTRLRNGEIRGYLDDIGRRLARSPHAGTFPFTFTVVRDPKINAFSLPGGPVYINSGAMIACDNEAQLAGVMAHEMSHVALRHGTSQLSKQELIALPAMLASAAFGRDSIIGRLAQLGIGLGAGSVLLHYSRGNEAQADYNGAEIMADAGYDPIEMARFFEKLESKSHRQGALEQFLSDHPNPGNRVEAVKEEVRQMPRRDYQEDSPRFHRMRDLVVRLQGRPAVTPRG